MISDEKMRSMSNQKMEEIEKTILNLENQFTIKLINTGKIRNVGMVNRMSLIAAELLSNEAISESICRRKQTKSAWSACICNRRFAGILWLFYSL